MLKAMEVTVGKARITLIQGDITDQDTDAIVNAANSSLMGGGGVDGAIHRKGGPSILEECRMIRASRWPDGLPTGKAVMTSGGGLRARHVIHTVGPIYGGEEEAERALAKAYGSSLELALEKGLKTISFPSISTGAYGFPIEKASEIALKTIKEFLQRNEGLQEVRLVLFSEEDLQVYERAMERTWPSHSQERLQQPGKRI
jgi:O-acetyl-ADP-ribose deacetylase (regulator of RNase III)